MNNLNDRDVVIGSVTARLTFTRIEPTSYYNIKLASNSYSLQSNYARECEADTEVERLIRAYNAIYNT